MANFRDPVPKYGRTDEWRAYLNIPRWVTNGQPYVYKTINHRQNFANPVNGANTQMIERALRCARLKIIKNTNNVHHTSFPGYSAELWWRSKHGTTPFNDPVAEVVRQYPMH